MNASGGCEAAVTARARIGRAKFRECGELLNSKRFSLKVKGIGLSELCKSGDVMWE